MNVTPTVTSVQWRKLLLPIGEGHNSLFNGLILTYTPNNAPCRGRRKYGNQGTEKGDPHLRDGGAPER